VSSCRRAVAVAVAKLCSCRLKRSPKEPKRLDELPLEDAVEDGPSELLLLSVALVRLVAVAASSTMMQSVPFARLPATSIQQSSMWLTIEPSNW